VRRCFVLAVVVLSNLMEFICCGCFTRRWWIVMTKPMRLHAPVRNWLDRPERAFSLLRCEGSCWILDSFCVDKRFIRLLDDMNASLCVFFAIQFRAHMWVRWIVHGSECCRAVFFIPLMY